MAANNNLLSPEQFKSLYPETVEKIRNEINADEWREEWLKKRRGRFTASGIHKLFTRALAVSKGQVAETYIMEVAAELFGANKEQVYAAPLQWGNDHEVEAVETYMKRYKRKITKYGLNQEFINWGDKCGGTPDGYIGKTQTAQVKCPYNPGVHLKYLRMKTQEDFKKSFPMYYVQTQCEILFTGRKSCEFISYDPRFEHDWQFKTLTLKPDAVFQPILIARLKEVEKEVEQIVLEICGKA